jgi:hypothetical protein
MNASPSPQPLYLQREPDPVFVTLHRPAAQNARDTAVVLCPPFGWEEVCSYRSLRFWAQRLAQDGYGTLRLSLPGTGDSGGNPRDQDRVGAWVAAIGAAAAWLREETGAGRIVVVGIGLSGILAYLSAADGAAIDDLVLWGAPARGHAMLRQLRAFSKLERADFSAGVSPPPPPAAGEIEAGGFVMSAETVTRLEAIDLTQVPLPRAGERRVLLLDRDGLAVDAALSQHLQQLGTTITRRPGDGFADMTSHPQEARPPLAVIDHVRAWLLEKAGPAAAGTTGGGAPAVDPSGLIRVGDDGAAVRETPVAIPQSFGELAGVLTEPLNAQGHGLGVVLLNAGAMRRTGPSRMWVEAARRWAVQGIPTLRLDAEAIGDADGDEAPYRDDGALYTPGFVPQVLATLDFLQRRGVAERFVVAGLCAGANWSFHAALTDARVQGVMLINPRALIYSPEIGPARDFRALRSQPLSLAKIRRLATGPRLRSFLGWMLSTPGRWWRRLTSGEPPSALVQRDLDTALDRLVASGKRVLFLFSEHEPVMDELTVSGREQRLTEAPNVTFEHVAVRDHTMRPGSSQREAHAALDRALAREPGISLSPGDPPSPHGQPPPSPSGVRPQR